ncbi:TPA: YbdK family carboxylate-amine ligase [Serratia odorifera]|nr:glutamate--cysteine ligase [Serratia odorifera]
MPRKFKPSTPLSIGTEIELQLIDIKSLNLSDKAALIVADINDKKHIKHELTRSMLEINSSVHLQLTELKQELAAQVQRVRATAQRHQCDVTGGGRHLCNDWKDQLITNAQRYKKLATRFGYISKMACVFGQHIHIGVSNGDESIYLCHALTPYFPQLLALSASSPYYQGEDTLFASSRFSAQNSFPNYGCIEKIYSWQEFTEYYDTLTSAGVIESIKDIYWDARPKPELGTVEIRVCDTPLHISHAANLVGYCRLIARYLLKNRHEIIPEYNAFSMYNKLNACRHGLQADYVDAQTLQRCSLAEHILTTLTRLHPEAVDDEERQLLQTLERFVRRGANDADNIRRLLDSGLTQPETIKRMCDALLVPMS